MKQAIGTFFNNTNEEFQLFVEIFENLGYEVAKQGPGFQGVVITNPESEVVDENKEEA